MLQQESAWMPWNYRDSLARLATAAAAQYHESCLAGSDRRRPGLGYILKCPEIIR
jgi:hypothetical protein